MSRARMLLASPHNTKRRMDNPIELTKLLTTTSQTKTRHILTPGRALCLPTSRYRTSRLPPHPRVIKYHPPAPPPALPPCPSLPALKMGEQQFIPPRICSHTQDIHRDAGIIPAFPSPSYEFIATAWLSSPLLPETSIMLFTESCMEARNHLSFRIS